MMAKLAEIGSPRATPTSRGDTSRGSCASTSPSSPTRRSSSTCGPSFWPNTPDILDDHLRHAPPSAFALRFVLAATLVPLYGIYSGYELCENEPADDTTTEYRHSEKYELKARDYEQEPSLAPLIRR